MPEHTAVGSFVVSNFLRQFNVLAEANLQTGLPPVKEPFKTFAEFERPALKTAP